MQDYKTLPELFYFIKENRSQSALLNYRVNNVWVPISTKDFADAVEYLTAGLKKIGVKKDDKVGIISNPSPFWVMADLAISLAGAVTVPIFRRISPENLEFEIKDSGMRTVFIGDPNEYGPVTLYGKGIKQIITIGFVKNDKTAVSFEELIDEGKLLLLGNPNLLLNKFANPQENDLFTIIYTSGSTGIPKGVMLTHRNIISQVHAAAEAFDVEIKRDRAITSLPLSHIFERMVMYFYLSKGVSVYFVDDLNNIGNLIRETHPTIMTVVPRLLEKIQSKMRLSAEENHGLKQKIAVAAIKRAETKDVGKWSLSPLDFIYKKLVYSKLWEAMGGSFRYVISGSASLPYDTGRFFMNIGMPLYEGYGLTEAAPVISANQPGKRKLGTVGMPFPSVMVKIADDGEVLAKGPNIMMGYYNNIDETTKALDSEGFLHTGDLGKFDEDGFLKISGRKKELFKKSTGEYVAPVPIENTLLKLRIIETAVVVAESKKFVSCLLFPNFEEVDQIKSNLGLNHMSTGAFLDTDIIHKMIADHITEMNKHLHHTEEVQKFKIIKEPISIESGELTPTMKIRRTIIEEKFKKEIDEIYRE